MSGRLKKATNVIRGALPTEKVNGIPASGISGVYTGSRHTPISGIRSTGLPTFGTKTINSGLISGVPVTRTSEAFVSHHHTSKSPITSRRYDTTSGLLRGTHTTGIVTGNTVRHGNVATSKDFRGTIMGTETQLKSGTVTTGGLVTRGGTLTSEVIERTSSVSASRRTPLSRGPIPDARLISGDTSTYTGDGRIITATAAEFILRPNTRNLPTRSVVDGTTDVKNLVTVGGMRTVDSGKLLLSTSTDKDRGIRVTKDIKVTNFGTATSTSFGPVTTSITGTTLRSGIKSPRSPVVKNSSYFERVSTSRPRTRVGETTVTSTGTTLTSGVRSFTGGTLATGTTITGNPVSVKRGNVVSSGTRTLMR